MIEGFAEALEHFKEKRKAFERKYEEFYHRSHEEFPYELRELVCANDGADVDKLAGRIKELYKAYTSDKEGKDHITFLYDPKIDEIKEALTSKNATYIGMMDGDNIMGVVKLERYSNEHKPAFFRLPPWEGDDYSDVYGLSGLYVKKTARQKDIGKRFLDAAIGCLHWMEAQGVYADCDFRNFKSFKSLIPYMDLVGFTDARQGAEDERTIYSTFYHSFEYEPTREYIGKVLDYAGQYSPKDAENMDGVVSLLIDNLNDMGKVTGPEIIEYGDASKGEHNKFYVLETPVRTTALRITLGKWNPEYKQAFKQDKDEYRKDIVYLYDDQYLGDFDEKPGKGGDGPDFSQFLLREYGR